MSRKQFWMLYVASLAVVGVAVVTLIFAIASLLPTNPWAKMVVAIMIGLAAGFAHSRGMLAIGREFNVYRRRK